jgi:uncharacterized protein (TIGR00369 family)
MILPYCQQIFDQTPFMRTLGARLVSADAGVCEIEAPITPELTQHNGFVHAGVQAGLADHSCGVAAASLLDAGQTPLSIEFKINLLRPAVGQTILTRAKVLKAGRTVSVVECDVFVTANGISVQTAKMVATIAVRTSL